MTEFWKQKSLTEMSQKEWELLCDGCGRCCLLRLEDEDSGEIFTTRLSCNQLDIGKCRCKAYGDRHQIVPDCIALTPENIGSLDWIPKSCAYRRLYEGRELAWWHPLVSGDPDSVHEAGISVRPWAIDEDRVKEEDVEKYIYEYNEA